MGITTDSNTGKDIDMCDSNNIHNEEKANMATENDARDYHPSMTFIHPNGKGTGAALKFRLYPAHENNDGFIMMSMSNQMTVVYHTNGVMSPPRFDYDDSLDMKLSFNEISLILQVLRGECESIYDGKGIYHRSDNGCSTVLRVRHVIEPTSGYMFTVNRMKDDTESNGCILLSCAEGLGMMEVFSASLQYMCFGVPSNLPHA